MKNIKEMTPCVYPDHFTMNPFVPMAPSCLMLSAENPLNHYFFLVLAVPYKILLVFSSIAIQLGMSMKRTSWKCWVTLYLELGQCTVLTCWIVCRIDSSGNLWILKAWHPLLEPKDSSVSETYQLRWDLPTTDMDAWPKVLAPDIWLYFPLISKQGEFWTFSQGKKQKQNPKNPPKNQQPDPGVLDWLSIAFTRKLAVVR